MFVRSLLKPLLGLTAALFVFALGAPRAHAAPTTATIWTFLDEHGHFLGNTGLDCDGGIFNYEGPVPDGSYARHTSFRCNVALPPVVHCYFVSDGAYGPSMHAISCTQMPGF
jgi:hypothetical protein